MVPPFFYTVLAMNAFWFCVAAIAYALGALGAAYADRTNGPRPDQPLHRHIRDHLTDPVFVIPVLLWPLLHPMIGISAVNEMVDWLISRKKRNPMS